jgi:hypothetical protein
MPTQNFYRNYYQVVAGIESCLEQKLQMPALILLYTLMDTFAWVVFGGTEKSTRVRFERWVKVWLLPQGQFSCSPSDLYAARCAILHTLTSEAALTKTGEAREVIYSWGTASPAKLQASIDVLGRENYVAVHINDLFRATREAIAQALEKSDVDQELLARLQIAASKHFANMENEKVDRFLDIYGNATSASSANA